MRMERRDFMSVNIMQVEKYCRTVIDMCLLFIIFSFKRKFEILYGLLVGKKKKKKEFVGYWNNGSTLNYDFI